MNAPLAKEQIALLMSDSLTLRTTALQGTDGTVAEPRPSAWSVFTATCRKAWASLMDMPRRRAVLEELSLLSDRELADVGLTRAELSSVFDPAFAGRGRR